MVRKNKDNLNASAYRIEDVLYYRIFDLKNCLNGKGGVRVSGWSNE